MGESEQDTREERNLLALLIREANIFGLNKRIVCLLNVNQLLSQTRGFGTCL